MRQIAVFEGLIVDEKDQLVQVTYIGDIPHYVVDDEGFLRHIPSEKVDRPILALMEENVLENKEAVIQGMLQFMGKDDLFTKAAVEAAINQMGENMEKFLEIGMPAETRNWLGMMGFKVVIDVHGDVLNVNLPSGVDYDE
ncbi:MAG: hypothetical protein JXA21_19995 [Anaerolineae bacterium]|nr:hypothetical protein [Anaerolineae bacterium]